MYKNGNEYFLAVEIFLIRHQMADLFLIFA